MGCHEGSAEGGGGGGKDKKKETKLGLAHRKADEFGEWYSEVVVESEMISYYDVSGGLCVPDQCHQVSDQDAGQGLLMWQRLCSGCTARGAVYCFSLRQMSICHDKPEGLPSRVSRAQWSWAQALGICALQSVHVGSTGQAGRSEGGQAQQHLGFGLEPAPCWGKVRGCNCCRWSPGMPSQASCTLRLSGYPYWLHWRHSLS